MFTVVLKDDRSIFRMKSGKPFLYSSRELADRGRTILEGHHKIKLVVVPA